MKAPNFPDPNPTESNSRRVVSISSVDFSMLLTNCHRVELLHELRPKPWRVNGIPSCRKFSLYEYPMLLAIFCHLGF